jgi:hypothetical protein
VEGLCETPASSLRLDIGISAQGSPAQYPVNQQFARKEGRAGNSPTCSPLNCDPALRGTMWIRGIQPVITCAAVRHIIHHGYEADELIAIAAISLPNEVFAGLIPGNLVRALMRQNSVFHGGVHDAALFVEQPHTINRGNR